MAGCTCAFGERQRNSQERESLRLSKFLPQRKERLLTGALEGKRSARLHSATPSCIIR